jgi:flagellar basal body-associated protein FliL
MEEGPIGGSGLRVLKIITIVMGVLILVGTSALIVMVVKRGGSSSPAAHPSATAPTRDQFATTLDEPAGTSIASVTAVDGRLALQLRGGGPDRVVLVDPATGAVVGRVVVGH